MRLECSKTKVQRRFFFFFHLLSKFIKNDSRSVQCPISLLSVSKPAVVCLIRKGQLLTCFLRLRRRRVSPWKFYVMITGPHIHIHFDDRDLFQGHRRACNAMHIILILSGFECESTDYLTTCLALFCPPSPHPLLHFHFSSSLSVSVCLSVLSLIHI